MSQANNGILFSLTMALIVLTLTTSNILISLIAIASIGAVILCMMSLIKIQGWQFGMIESTCVIVFIGISVDYVVHICHQYIHALEEFRGDRMNHAFK